MNKNSKITAVQLQGINTSTPDNNVPDGACEELHNLRISGDAWRAVKPLSQRIQFFKDGIGLRLVYKHPISNAYIFRPIDGEGPFIEIKVTDQSAIDGDNFNVFGETENMSPNAKVGHFGKVIFFYDNNNVHYYTYNESTRAYSSNYIVNPDNISVKVSNIDVRVNEQSEIADIERIVFARSDETYMADEYLKDMLAKEHIFANEPSGGYGHLIGVPLCDEAGNPAIPEGYLDHWYGELMFFIAARSEDGSIVQQTLPRYISSGLMGNSDKLLSENFLGEIFEDDSTLATTYTPGALVCSNGKYYERCQLLTKDDVDVADDDIKKLFITPNNLTVLPELKLEVKDIANITDVAIYATRVLPILDYSKVLRLQLKGYEIETDYSKVFADNDYANQPFYMVKAFPISEFTKELEGGYSLTTSLTYENMLKDLAASSELQYEPQKGIFNKVLFEKYFEYNNRAHLGNIIDNIYEGNAQEGNQPFEGMMRIGNEDNFIKIYADVSQDKDGDYWRGRAVAYPDFRLTAIRAIQDDTAANKWLKMQQGAASNLSIALAAHKPLSELHFETCVEGTLHYYRGDNSGTVDIIDGKILCFSREMTPAYCKHKQFDFGDYTEGIKAEYISQIKATNKIQVSEVNNIFNLPFANTYTVGTQDNHIVAISSSAIEVSDSKWGEFPVFVFTSEGIYAMHLSDGVVYVGTSVVNQDVAINPNTLPLNGAILYVTDEGLHILGDNQNRIISTPINSKANYPDVAWLKRVKFYHSRENNELVVIDPAKMAGEHIAYIYSFSSNMWSTRTIISDTGLSNVQLLNVGDLVVDFYEGSESDNQDSVMILDPQNELRKGSGSVTATFTTRPIKFDGLEYKRIDTLLARLSSDEMVDVAITIEGSIDLKTWFTLRDVRCSADKDIRIRHFSSSARYIRIHFKVDTNATNNISLLGFIAEWFPRFRSHIR